MSCCKEILANIVKTEHIVQGNLFNLLGIKYEFTDDRIITCHKCDEQTWMTKAEYLNWLTDNGIEILANLNQLETLPKLPKFGQDEKRRSLFCRICKCFIPAKARVKEEKCDKWSN